MQPEESEADPANSRPTVTKLCLLDSSTRSCEIELHERTDGTTAHELIFPRGKDICELAVARTLNCAGGVREEVQAERHAKATTSPNYAQVHGPKLASH
jgi:hypothetical protein